jgi:hypothetical protein
MSKYPHLLAHDLAVSSFELDPRNRRESPRQRQLNVNSKPTMAATSATLELAFAGPSP